MKCKVRPANRARTSVAVLQASARFQFIHLVIMKIGLTSVLLLIMGWLNVNFQMRLPTSILWPLLLWALYLGALNQQMADMTTKRMVSCACGRDLMSIAYLFSLQQETAFSLDSWD